MSHFRLTDEQFAAHQRRVKADARTVKLGMAEKAPPKPAEAKRSKYGAEKTVVDGVKFDSKKEARRYQDLVLMQKAGQIRTLRRQVPYHVMINGIPICVWFADFVYYEDGHKRVEDTKGFATAIYKLKKKLVEAQFGIKILET